MSSNEKKIDLGSLVFMAEDFAGLPQDVTMVSLDPEEKEALAKHVNRLLRRRLENTPVVYGFSTGSERWLWDTDSGKKDTHTARLVCVKPLIAAKLRGDE